MKQVFQNLRNGNTEVVEVPVPKPQPGTALVRTATSLVSAGTERMLVKFAEKSLVGKARSRPDLVRQMIDKARREGVLTAFNAALNRLDQPLSLGYSSAGTIVEIGDGMSGFHVGQRVVCAGGGYAVHAEFAVVPSNLMTPLPESIDFESGAFATLGAIALHGFRLGEVKLGEQVAVIGLGLLGLLMVGIARAAGCRVFGVDMVPARVSLAKNMGAEAYLRQDAEETAIAFSRGQGCDGVFICADTSSNDPIELAGIVARDRARVISLGSVGLDIPRNLYFDKELTFLVSRSYGPGRYDPSYEEGGQDYPIGYVRWTEGRNLAAFVDLLAEGHLDVSTLITHRFSIDNAVAAYDLITGKKDEPNLGVLLTYPLESSKTSQSDRTITIGERTRTDTTGQPLRLGVLGAGNFARAVMLPVLSRLRGVELHGIATASGGSSRYAAKRFGFQYATSDESRIINDPEINTVAILTRHNLHANQVLDALKAGKHTFCEKPLALSREALDEITSELKVPDSPLLMVGYNRRFAPLAVEMKAFLMPQQEPLAAHYRVNAGYLPLSHWLHDPLQGGGRLVGEGCHFVDFLTFLVGAPPMTVVGQSLPDTGRYNLDNVVLTYRFKDGSLGTLTYLANGDKSLPKERVEVFAGGRVAILNDFRSLETIANGRRRTQRTRLRQQKGHREEWEAFKNAITDHGLPPIPYEHIIGVERATLASLEALKNSGEKIQVI
jgi:predicted dehydrogenase/threonine dehydrogenase-like Zn-dependent dehydrogenase